LDDLISADIRDFITRHIDTVSQLEALLLLRAERQEHWSLERIAARVYTSPEEIDEVLERFCREGFLVRDGDSFRYECADPATDAIIGRVANAYTTHLIAITNLIHGKSRDVRAFADAFKLRKDK
jgi:hypothetical protein